MNSLPVALATVIRDRMARSHLSLYGLHKKAGVSYSTLYRNLQATEDRSWSTSDLQAIGRVFGVEASELVAAAEELMGSAAAGV